MKVCACMCVADTVSETHTVSETPMSDPRTEETTDLLQVALAQPVWPSENGYSGWIGPSQAWGCGPHNVFWELPSGVGRGVLLGWGEGSC
jgi:hypothetical protein